MFFIHIHVLFLKHLRAKFKERNKLIIRKKVSLDEQTMFKDKYTRICSRKIEAIVFHVVQIFCNACEKMVTKSLLFSVCDVINKYIPQVSCITSFVAGHQFIYFIPQILPLNLFKRKRGYLTNIHSA